MKTIIREEFEYFKEYINFIQQHWNKQTLMKKEEIDNLIPQLKIIENTLYQLDSKRIKIPEDMITKRWTIKSGGRWFSGPGRITEIIPGEKKLTAKITGEIQLKEYPEETNVEFEVAGTDENNQNLTIQWVNELIPHDDDTNFKQNNIEQLQSVHKIEYYVSSNNQEYKNMGNLNQDEVDTVAFGYQGDNDITENFEAYDNENMDQENGYEYDDTWSGADDNTYSTNYDEEMSKYYNTCDYVACAGGPNYGYSNEESEETTESFRDQEENDNIDHENNADSQNNFEDWSNQITENYDIDMSHWNKSEFDKQYCQHVYQNICTCPTLCLDCNRPTLTFSDEEFESDDINGEEKENEEIEKSSEDGTSSDSTWREDDTSTDSTTSEDGAWSEESTNSEDSTSCGEEDDEPPTKKAKLQFKY